MPSATKSAAAARQYDDLDNYDVGDLSDDPFASPSPAGSTKAKRKADQSGLGIDKEVSVQKRVRPPTVKLDEDRLLSQRGIPELRKRAGRLRFKGKGHEVSDVERLLSMYQLWLDDLFPKARFLDALEMVEKLGHKKRLVTARAEWLNENAPSSRSGEQDDEDNYAVADVQPNRLSTPSGAAATEPDLYSASPNARPPVTGRLISQNAEPEEDELDDLMGETENEDRGKTSARLAPHQDNNEEDDLDALIAEAEVRDTEVAKTTDESRAKAVDKENVSFDAEEAAMREMDDLW